MGIGTKLARVLIMEQDFMPGHTAVILVSGGRRLADRHQTGAARSRISSRSAQWRYPN
jgi:hypothetical protein